MLGEGLGVGLGDSVCTTNGRAFLEIPATAGMPETENVPTTSRLTIPIITSR